MKRNACEDIQRRWQGEQEHDGFEDIAVFLQLFTNTNKKFALMIYYNVSQRGEK